jgi:hypothetical protein
MNPRSNTQDSAQFPARKCCEEKEMLPEISANGSCSDNGVPFASAHGLLNLSKLPVSWLRLGIGLERIKPGHPQQNGRHERMHLTLKKEATKPAAANPLQQQAPFDEFIEVFNQKRPQEALEMKSPADIYTASTRPYPIPRVAGHRLLFPRQNHRGHPLRPYLSGRKKINFSTVFAGQACRHQGSARRHLAGQLSRS